MWYQDFVGDCQFLVGYVDFQVWFYFQLCIGIDYYWQVVVMDVQGDVQCVVLVQVVGQVVLVVFVVVLVVVEFQVFVSDVSVEGKVFEVGWQFVVVNVVVVQCYLFVDLWCQQVVGQLVVVVQFVLQFFYYWYEWVCQ